MAAFRSGTAATACWRTLQGCRPEWLAELRAVCQRDGEPPARVTEVDARFAIRLESGPWLVAGVHSQGCDDRGRPGALAFHALFVGRFAYRWIGANPFGFDPRSAAPGARRTTIDHSLRGQLKRITARDRRRRIDEDDPRLPSILRAAAGRRRVIVQSSTPIDALARTVWSKLPARTRMRASLATWAFDTANAFDLVAVPKLTGLVCDPTDLIFSSLSRLLAERRSGLLSRAG